MGILDHFKKRGWGFEKRKWKIGDKMLDRYEIKDIREGGLGVVYIAFDHHWRQWFAIKTFKDEFLWREEVVKKFLREAETWVKLDKHRNIVRAEFVQRIEGKPYIFLEYIDGKSLRAWINEKLDIQQALDFAIQICSGMEYAAEKMGIVHRDLKPENVLITRDKVAKITDFGLVKILEDAIVNEKLSGEKLKLELEPWKTKLGQVWGTRPYISPEQYKDPRSADIRSDIFSFGVMLYEMLTQYLPFEVEREGEGGIYLEYLSAGGVEEIIEPKQRNSAIPEELNSLVMKCLNQDPKQRFQNFSELKAELLNIYEKLFGRKYEIQVAIERLTAADWNHKGISLYNIGRFEEAITCFDKALELNQKDALIWNNKGLALYKNKRFEEAVKCFDRALLLNPRYLSAWNNRGLALQSTGKFEEAITCFDRALELNQKDALIWNNKGLALQSTGKFEEAITCFDRALELNQKDAPAWNNKGVALYNLKKYDEALRCYRNSLEINPRNSLVWNNIGAVLLALNRADEAIFYFKKALEIDDRDLKAWNNLGSAYSQLGLHSEAMKCFDALLEREPTNYEAWCNKGAAISNLGKLEESLSYFNKAIELNPEYAPAWANKGLVLHSLARFEEAITCFDRALELEPDNHQTWTYKGVSLANLERYEEAAKCFEKAIEKNPMNEEAWNNLALTQFNLGRFEEAVKSYEKALQINPHSKRAKRGKEESLKYLYLTTRE
jgi:tetratricopeptide (TPR) repeat protein/predicted Ser/Thr protein kinase